MEEVVDNGHQEVHDYTLVDNYAEDYRVLEIPVQTVEFFKSSTKPTRWKR